MSNFTISPAWKRYNDLQNEGGEGYNPHTKWAPAAPATAAAKIDNRMLRDERGNLIPVAKLSARLAADLAKLPALTNSYAVEICQSAINHARAQLGA